jgi:hypothetical protein
MARDGFAERRRLATLMSAALERRVFSLPPLLRADIGAEFQFAPYFHDPLGAFNAPPPTFCATCPTQPCSTPDAS